eukprot:scpid79692/ scgid12341/ 
MPYEHLTVKAVEHEWRAVCQRLQRGIHVTRVASIANALQTRQFASTFHSSKKPCGCREIHRPSEGEAQLQSTRSKFPRVSVSTHLTSKYCTMRMHTWHTPNGCCNTHVDDTI